MLSGGSELGGLPLLACLENDPSFTEGITFRQHLKPSMDQLFFDLVEGGVDMHTIYWQIVKLLWVGNSFI